MHEDHGWQGAFAPRQYLTTYYDHIGRENRALLQFLADAYADLPTGIDVLDLGTGPCAYQLIAASRRARSIEACELLDANRLELERWIRAHPESFDWRKFTQAILEAEGHPEVAPYLVALREEEARTRIRVLGGDLLKPHTLPRGPYDVVSMQFVAESLTDCREEFTAAMRHGLTLLKAGGRLIMSALLGARSYAVGAARFPSVPLTPADIRASLMHDGVPMEQVQVREVEAEDENRDSYPGLCFVQATRPLAIRQHAP